MELRQQLLTENDCYKSGRTLAPKGVMVHSLGVAQPDVEVFLRTWNRPDVEKCVHAFVHRDGVVQTLPWTCRGWHAGVGTSGKSANDTHLSFEICEPAGHTYEGGTMIGYDPEKNAAYFGAVYQNAVALTARLCKEFHLDPLADGVVLCHSEGHTRGIATNHADVMQWFPKHDKTMDDFRADVKAALTEGDEDEMKLYQYASEVPDWAKASVEKDIQKGVIKLDESGAMGVWESNLQPLVWLDRTGALD